MKKMAITMILLGTLSQLMIGCKENISNNNNLVSTNTVIATSTSTNTNNEQKDDEFFYEEIDYQMSEEDMEKLQMILGEVYFLNKNNGYYREYNMKNGLPNGDEEKREFMRMLIEEHFYVYKIFEEYNNASINVPALNIPMEKINYFLNLALGTTFSNNYKEYFELQAANRGTEQPYSIISSIKQISSDEVRIEGKIGSANENGDGFGLRKENFIAIGKIVDDKTLGGITITEFKCNNQFKDEFVFWDSDVKYLTDNDLKNLSLDELAYARNEIYARYGYAFKEEKFKNYFESKNWYKPDENFIPDDSNLNEYEIANKNLILKYEDNLKTNNGEEMSDISKINYDYLLNPENAILYGLKVRENQEYNGYITPIRLEPYEKERKAVLDLNSQDTFLLTSAPFDTNANPKDLLQDDYALIAWIIEKNEKYYLIQYQAYYHILTGGNANRFNIKVYFDGSVEGNDLWNEPYYKMK